MYQYKKDKNVTPIELQKLFTQVDWAKDRGLDDIEKMLSNSTFQMTCWLDTELVGFLRVLSDMVYRGFIEDVIVDSRYRYKGIGKQLINFALKELDTVDEVVLGCTEANVKYYEMLGFKKVTHAYMQLGKK
jgi:predicted GNAT family N-acyltransferase